MTKSNRRVPDLLHRYAAILLLSGTAPIIADLVDNNVGAAYAEVPSHSAPRARRQWTIWFYVDRPIMGGPLTVTQKSANSGKKVKEKEVGDIFSLTVDNTTSYVVELKQEGLDSVVFPIDRDHPTYAVGVRMNKLGSESLGKNAVDLQNKTAMAISDAYAACQRNEVDRDFPKKLPEKARSVIEKSPDLRSALCVKS